MKRISQPRIKYTILSVLLFMIASCIGRSYTVKPSVSHTARARQLGFHLTANDNPHLYDITAEWLGTPHKSGGSSKRGTDCSGFVMQLYKEVYHKKLQRSSSAILTHNCQRITRQQLREGDLVFFYTGKRSTTPSHVGVYLKEDLFVHASSSSGVMISSLKQPYYTKRWITGGRVR